MNKGNKTKLPNWLNRLNTFANKYMTASTESAGENILNKTIEKANSAKSDSERKEIYNDSAKKNLSTTGASLLALSAPDLIWSIGTSTGRKALSKAAIDMGASLVGGEIVNNIGEKLTGQPTTGRFVLNQILGNRGEQLYDNNNVIRLGADIITNPGYGMGTWAIKGAIKGATNAGANFIDAVNNKIKINSTIKDAIKSGKLKFGEPTIYTGIHQSNSPIEHFQFPFNQRWDVVNHGADPNGAFFTLGDAAKSGFLKDRPWTSTWEIKSQRPLIQTGEIFGPKGTKNNIRNAIVRYGRKHGADAIEFRGIADNQLQNQNILFATNNTELKKIGQLFKGKRSTYNSPVSNYLDVSTAEPVMNPIENVKTIISKVNSGEEAPLVTKIKDIFGKEADVPVEWAAAQRLESTKKAAPRGFDYFWRGTDQNVIKDPQIKTLYDALFGGNYDLVTSGYNAGRWQGGAPIRLSTEYIKDPNTLLLAVPKGSIKDLGNFNGQRFRYLTEQTPEGLYKVSQYNKLYQEWLKANDWDRPLIMHRLGQLEKWFEQHPYKFNGELANSTDDIAEILVEQSNKLPYNGVLLRGVRDGGKDAAGNSILGNDVIYNYKKVAPKLVSPYNTFEFNWGNQSFLKSGGKINKSKYKLYK